MYAYSTSMPQTYRTLLYLRQLVVLDLPCFRARQGLFRALHRLEIPIAFSHKLINLESKILIDSLNST